MLTAKATARRTEVSIRTALGATRGRLVRQLLAENIPLSLLGGAGGLVVAVGALGLLRSALPAEIPRVNAIVVDGWVLAFTLATALLAGLAFGLVPSLTATRASLTGALKEGRGGPGAGQRLRGALVVLQLAVTLVLANGAVLMLQSYAQLAGADRGFESENVLTMSFVLRGPRYAEPERIRAFFRDVEQRVAAMPGVEHVGATSKLPLRGGTNTNAEVEGRPPDPNPRNRPLVEVSVITPEYFGAMGIPLLAGENLASHEGRQTVAGAVINESMARRLWPDEEPLGKRFSIVDPPMWKTVVGIVGDVRQWGPERRPVAEAYLPYDPGAGGQQSFARVRYLAVRSSLDPATIVAGVRGAVAEVDNNVAPSDIRTMEQVFGTAVAGRRFNTLIAGAFGAMALVLVAAGIYGIMSFYVGQRAHEIGVRIALGSSRSAVIGFVVRRGLRWAVSGVAIGLVGIVVTARVTASMLYMVSATDPFTVAAGMAFLVVLALLGSCVPAWRATRVSPVHALRCD